MKTLVIEDSTSSLKLLCSYIEKIGISTIPAENGATGIDLFLSEHPDLILLDIILPDLDGYEVARQIRLLEPPGEWTPIIFLSSMNKDKDIEMGIAAGGDDYLLKPISEVVLAAKIRAMQRIIQMRQSLLVLTRKLDSANQELKRLTSLDGLTGIPNRRHFDEVLAREWRRAMRQGEELSILMCDIDFFKNFNDTFGHQKGDECLRQVANALADSLDRGGDVLARYGGEEFIAVLPGTTLEGASFIAAQMRQSICQLNISHPDTPFGKVTASFGVASAVAMPETDPLKIVGAADTAMYKAKKSGRNRVFRTTSLDPQED
ncbi:Diguanylate cyclase (GGDEF) domain-containing protein [Candidatus Propionivibrio aalborgensis]|uniref:diguanylate cyclase n=1 Tax=Candidatus Propionivibrio aalborgensis TaxID=1860101 RepID=A0A1A8XVG8_9RHOO|nr:diguanylate cyclase [Candidatus Propionivibrio aalborgensis]MBK9026417.1 diguanylate cyclase [Propionivibrio sp.]MBP6421726.1 diguanylate cyclase [Propionivibrio sp.]SBT08587.1 Diguanylate cyclase (GGDEF) domain-containing protein [Candidatus Propionivibrio aalborgensis]